MLHVETRAAFPQIGRRRRARLPGAGPSHVDDLRAGHQPSLPSSLAHSPRPVNLLTVHKEALIQEPDVPHSLCTNHHRGAERVIHREGGLLIIETPRIAPIEPCVVEAVRHKPQSEERLTQAREAEGTLLQGPIRVEQLRSRQPDVTMRLQEAQQELNSGGIYNGVGVQEPDVPRAIPQRLQRQVIGLDVPHVLRQGPQTYLGIPLSHKLSAAVCGRIVDNPYLRSTRTFG